MSIHEGGRGAEGEGHTAGNTWRGKGGENKCIMAVLEQYLERQGRSIVGYYQSKHVPVDIGALLCRAHVPKKAFEIHQVEVSLAALVYTAEQVPDLG